MPYQKPTFCIAKTYFLYAKNHTFAMQKGGFWFLNTIHHSCKSCSKANHHHYKRHVRLGFYNTYIAENNN